MLAVFAICIWKKKIMFQNDESLQVLAYEWTFLWENQLNNGRLKMYINRTYGQIKNLWIFIFKLIAYTCTAQIKILCFNTSWNLFHEHLISVRDILFILIYDFFFLAGTSFDNRKICTQTCDWNHLGNW